MEACAEIANTIKNNLADALFIQQFAKKQEEEDKIKQKNNFLMFGLSKSSSYSVVTSVKDDYNKLKCLYENPITLSHTDIVSIVLLGSKNADKNRSLLIKCSNKNKNLEFIKGSKNLKLQDQENVKIWPIPDYTIKERKESKSGITFKEQKKNGETNLTIRNNKIFVKVSQINMK